MSVLYKMKILISLVFLIGCSWPQSSYNEAYYQNRWCGKHGGETEVVLSDRSRCDCLTDRYAIEFDFAGKWEAVEQSLNYARLTGKNAGIVFICRKPGDMRKIKRTLENIRFYKLPIKVWHINC